ncbi:hypothetical protein GQ53DRAFT_473156 [Thozetella sp. PMI_491]|nr:hypothetical protein GQ53DRAFT_473156 [Thozetella sp. PMI_491]
MSTVQLSFSLRVSSGVKTVHLLGSWDNYAGQLPLSKDKSSSKSGSWKGTFRFQQALLEPGQRYWYYYIIDGYHVSHNPSEPSTTEPTTGRELNILDVPKSKSSSKSHHSSSKSSSKHKESSHSSRRSKHSSSGLSLDIPKGRPLSVSQIKAPKPMSPHATKHILDGEFDEDELSRRFETTNFYEDEDIITDFGATSPVSASTGSNLSWRSDSSSPTSEMSGYSTPLSDCSSCTCERYGITRSGDRVRLDCGGTRCGYDDENSSSCSSDEEEYVSSSRRNGIVVRR